MGFLQSLTKVVIGICAALYARHKSIELLQALRLSQQKASGGSALKFEVKNLNQWNDSVYELYRPPNDIVPSVEVVFFHGFQHGDYEKAHLSTWLSGDELCIWPQIWLQENPKLRDARILTVSYGGLLPIKPGQDMYPLVENLQHDLLSARVGQEPRCPVVLVGHSFGGLVIKMLCVEAFSQTGQSNRDLDLFLDSLKGFFFYATPHHGVSFVNPVLLMAKSDLRTYVEVLSKERARLNSRFEKLQNEHPTWQIAGLGETVSSKWGKFFGLFVPEGSSRLGPNFRIDPGADHISISRPPSKISRRFTDLTRLLEGIVVDSNNKQPGNFQVLPKSIQMTSSVNNRVLISGLQKAVENVKEMLTTTIKLGFYGMGGIGKTTLAMALFNDVERSYDYTCFINEDKIQVQDLVLQNMHYRGSRITQNATNLKTKMRGKKLLLVLDGVNSITNFGIVKEFISDIALDKASRFVATSRDKRLLALEGYTLHPVEFLSFESSKALFLECVPNGRNLPFRKYVDGIVEECDGLPLTVEYVGKYLQTEFEESVWDQLSQALDDTMDIAVINENMWAKLKISYDNLSRKEKIMFLDAATVFYKYDISIAKAAWSTTGESIKWPWQRLVELSLVQEEPDGERTKIGFQKQLLSFGRMTALTSTENGCKENGYRIWNDSEKAFELLSADYYTMDEEDPQDVVALKSCSRDLSPPVIYRALVEQGMDLASHNYIPISGSELRKMRKLKYLWLEGFHINQLQDSPLPSRIVYLHLSSMSFSDFPFIPHRNRCMIILSLNETVGIDTLPANFGKLESLQILRIEDNNSLEGLPDSIGNLLKLKYLSIKLCPTLRRLPNSLGDLMALETLRIRSCNSVLALPESIGSLQTLKVVEIMECDLESLPDSLGRLSMLSHLSIDRCPSLRSLPDSLRDLMALEYLTINDCDSLSGLPNSLENLFKLKVIRITGCSSLGRLPGEFEALPALEHIELNQICLRRVPDLEMITSLRTLRLSWGRASRFPSLPECLQGHVTEENYTSSLTFSVVGGILQAGNFQDVPTVTVGPLEYI